jgi:hypothetical protein
MRANLRRAVSILPTAVVLWAGPAFSATLHVPRDFATIQAALNAAAPGDRILVAPGRWVGSLQFDGKDVALESTAGAEVTIIEASNGSVVDIGPGGRLAGFTITGGSATFAAGVAVHGAGTRIERNVVQDNEQLAGGFGAGIGGNGASPIVDGNTFRRNSCDTQFLSGVVSFVNSSSPQIINNVFEDNLCRAINMTLPTEAAPRVLNNTIVRNQVGIYVDRRVDTSAQVYRNNIIVENGVGAVAVFSSGDPGPVWEHNLVFGNDVNYQGTADQTGTNGNISVDPMFRDALLDYRLQAGSPAVDSGANATAPGTDFDGRTRPHDGNGDGIAVVDMGAFEFGRDVRISPPSGAYYSTQRFDLVIFIPDGSAVTRGRVLFDGQDMTSILFACARFGRGSPSAMTLRCPEVSLGALAEGIHEFSVRVEFADGTIESRTVRWELHRIIEP